MDELRRRVIAVKTRPLSRWTLGDIAAWMDVGVGLPQYARRLAAAMKADAATGVPPADVLCALDERGLAAKVPSRPSTHTRTHTHTVSHMTVGARTYRVVDAVVVGVLSRLCVV